MGSDLQIFSYSVGGTSSLGVTIDYSADTVLEVEAFSANPNAGQEDSGGQDQPDQDFNDSNANENDSTPTLQNKARASTTQIVVEVKGNVSATKDTQKRGGRQGGNQGRKRVFDIKKGANNYISTKGDDLSFGNGASNNDSAFTISVRFQPYEKDSVQVLVKKTNEYELVFNTDNKLIFKLYDADTSNYINTITNIPFLQNPFRWYTVIVTYDGNQSSAGVAIYVNGNKIPTTTTVVGSYSGMHNDTTVAACWGTEQFRGKMADMTVLKRELLQDDVTAVWQTMVIGYIARRSRILSANPRNQLNKHLGNTATPTSYPTVSRTGYQNAKGNYSVGFDDTTAIDFKRYPTGSTVDKRGMPYGGVKFPILLPSGSPYLNSSDLRYGIIKPFEQPDIPAIAAIPHRSTIGDWLVREVFYPGYSAHPNAYQPFKEHGNDIQSSSFYLTGTNPETTLPGFSRRLGDKTQVRIEMKPAATAYVLQWDKILGSVAGSVVRSVANTGDALPLSTRPYTGFVYYNFSNQTWEDKGLVDPSTGGTVQYHQSVAGDGPDLGSGVGGDTALSSLDATYRANKISSGTQYSPRQFIPPDGTHHAAVSNRMAAGPYYRVGTPTVAHFAPQANTYHATASQCLQMSDYISHPFLLEKVVVNFDRIEAQREWWANHETALDEIKQSDYMVFLYRQEKSCTRSSAIAESALGVGPYDGKQAVSSSNRYLVASASMCFYNNAVLYRDNPTTASWYSDYEPLHNPAWSHNWAYDAASDKNAATTNGMLVVSGAFTGSVSLEMTPAVTPQTFGGRTMTLNSEAHSFFTSEHFAGTAEAHKDSGGSNSSVYTNNAHGKRQAMNHYAKYRFSQIGHYWPGGTSFRPFGRPDDVGRYFDFVSPPGYYTDFNGANAALYAGGPLVPEWDESGVFGVINRTCGVAFDMGGTVSHGKSTDLTFMGAAAWLQKGASEASGMAQNIKSAFPIDTVDSRAQRPFGPGSDPVTIDYENVCHGPAHQGSAASPYLLFPSDQLILGIESLQQMSGTMLGIIGRDTAAGYCTNEDSFLTRIQDKMKNEVTYASVSGSFLRIPAGHTITITLYGSLVKDNEYHEPTEFHFGLNQHLDSVSVHEAVIGDSTPINEYLIEPTHMHSGTTQAEVHAFTGSFFAPNSIGPNKHHAIFGVGGAAAMRALASFSHDTIAAWEFGAQKFANIRRPVATRTNKKKAYAKQNNKHIPIARTSRYTDYSERIWDTVMPDAGEYYQAYNMQAANTDHGLQQGYTYTVTHPSGTISPIKVTCVGDAASGVDSLGGYQNTRAHPFPYWGNPTRLLNQEIHLFATSGSGCKYNEGGALDINNQQTARRITYGIGWDWYYSNLQRRPWIGLPAALGTGASITPTYGGFTDSHNTGSNGFKYGIAHTEPMYSEAVFRRNRFGQFRDMLEQRPYTAVSSPGRGNSSENNPVYVKFVDSDGNQVTGGNTSVCQNISNNCTSSVPYFEDNAVSGISLPHGAFDVLALLS